MSEYWVSQAKFYCKFCNVWIADNKPTRHLHDGGAKHKFNVDEFHKKKRNEKLFGARSETEIKQQLAEIERAAKEAVAADRLESTGLFYKQPAPVRDELRPPPPPQRSAPDVDGQNAKRGSFSNSDEGRGRGIEAVEEQLEIEEDNLGTYTVDGQTYLEGPKHENLLARGMNCEVFIEDADQWYSAVVLGRKDVAVPHTTVILRTFDVSYVRVESVDDEDSEAKSENADDSAEMDLSDSLAEEEDLNELNARGEGEKEKKEQKEREGDAVKSDSAARPPPRSVPPPPPPPTAEATAESAAEVLPVAKRSRVSRWDTPKTSSELDTAAAAMVLPGPLPPHPTPPPPPPVRPPSLLAAAAATSVIEDRNRSQHADDCAPTSSATAPVEAVAAERDPLATDSAAAEPEVEVIVLKGVRSDHLRLLCDEEGNVLGAHGEIVSTALSRGGEAPLVEVVASTGFGAWQTVSVRMVDEEEEAALREEEEMRAREEARRHRESQGQSSSSSKYREVQSTGSVVQEEDVMSTFDPYGTNLYKGMRVAGDVGQGQEEVETMAKKGEKVGFKKRKKAGTSSAAEEGTGPGAGSSSSAKGHDTASGASMSVSCGGRSASASAGTSDGYNSVKIKSENGTQDPYQQAPVLEEIYIKSEIKLEQGIKVEESDPDRPPTKMSFGFKHRNTRKSADDN